MLNTYLAQVNALLQSPPATTSLYSTSLLTTNINTARGQLAGESRSIRVAATLNLTAGTQVYPFSSIDVSSVSGVAGVSAIRQIWYGVATGRKWMRPRPFEWFGLYAYNDPVPQQGAPVEWAQFGQGTTGSIYISPPPDTSYTLTLDTECYPSALVTDADPEAIPYYWTDAVQFFAAFLTLLSAQTRARDADAQRMLALYEQFVARARRYATPDIMSYQNPQVPDPASIGVLPGTHAGAVPPGQGGTI